MDRILVRSALVRVAFVIVLLLVALLGSAHAEPASLAPALDAPVAAALFTPTRTPEGISWRARWVLTSQDVAALDEGARRVVRFAVPLPDTTSIEATFGVVPLREGGQVTGIVIDRAALDERTVAATVSQRATLEGGSPMLVGAPVAAGTSLQIVDGDLGAGARLEALADRTLERRIGYVAPAGTSPGAREEARRLTGYNARVTGSALYLRGDDVRRARGLHASLVTPSMRARHVSAAIGVLFALMIAGLVAATRKLRHGASVERADALLAAEVDALEPVEGRR